MGKQLFKESNSQLYALYKEGMRCKEEAYIRGKEDAYAEILKLVLTFRSARDLKHVPITQFMNALNSKLQELRAPPEKPSSTSNGVKTKLGFNQSGMTEQL